jgi:hypothetical protein
MHNGQTSDPLNPWSKALKKVSGKRTKTDADHEEMARIEWYASLYLKEGLPCLPGENWERVLLDAARKLKLGKQVQAGTFCPEAYGLEYDGPTEIDALWKDPRFVLTCRVKVNGNAVQRTRARFNDWVCTIDIRYDPLLVDLSQLHQIMTIAGDSIGIGDWRPKFGRFTAHPR